MRPIRIAPALAALAAAALLASCGDHALVLRVDVLSYMDSTLTQQSFGPLPAAPGGLASGEVALVSDQEVNLLDGLSNVADVQSVSMFVSTITHTTSGSGTDTIRVYMSDPNTPPRSTPPVLVRVMNLVAGAADTVATSFDGDQRVAQLFAERKFRLEVTTSLRGPTAGASLAGDVSINALDAVVVAKRSL